MTHARIHDRILKALRDHPLLSRRQLELQLNRPARSVRLGLAELAEQKLIVRYNGKQPGLHTRSLFALSLQGIAHLAQLDYQLVNEFVREYGLHPARMERLILNLERVFQLRTLFFWLTRGKVWRSLTWDVEVGKFFSVKHSAFWIPFHAAALMQRQPTESDPHGKEKRWALVVVELDVHRVPVERDRERLKRLIMAQKDWRYADRENRAFFPILLVIAQDEFRLLDYYTVLRTTAIANQVPMPHAYLTTFREMLSLRNNPANPIWYSTASEKQTALLLDAPGIAADLPEQLPWRKMPLAGLDVSASYEKSAKPIEKETEKQTGKNIETIVPELLTPLKPSADATEYARASMGTIALTLSPLEKRLLDEIAAHPLLNSKQLVSLVKATPQKVNPGLAHLGRFLLVETHKGKYVIAEKGISYLALIAGFGKATERYARARGWGMGFETLIRHWEHTQEENEFFLHLAAIAQKRGHTLAWYSELESRLYYEMRNRWHSFLPDGRGTYVAKGKRYEFVLEVDRSRMSHEKVRRKFAEYAACRASNVLRGEGIENLHVLVLTTSLERAETLRRTILPITRGLPVFITTIDRLRQSGADAPIWLKVEGSPAERQDISTAKTYCFDCFEARTK